jgi:hypothetical protein
LILILRHDATDSFQDFYTQLPAIQVYGTRNIRIVDLSIAPLTFSSHSQCSHPPVHLLADVDNLITLSLLGAAYAIAEKGFILFLSRDSVSD